MSADSLLIIILGFSIIFSAGLIQGITSFGFSLLAVPLLSFILPLKVVVPILIIYSFIMNSMILYTIRKHANLRSIAYLTIAGVMGTPVGANLLVQLNENVLKITVGIIITSFAIASYFGYKVHIKNEKLSYIPVGFVSGLLNGSVSMSGPPVIIFLTNQEVEKQVFRATLTSYFWIINITTIPIFIYKGLVTAEVVKYTVYLLPALIISVILGIRLGNKVNDHFFRKLTIILIIFMGVLSIISGVTG